MNNKKNLYVGMGMGMAVAGCAAMLMRPRKRRLKKTVGKALLSMSDLVDSISDSLHG